LIRERVRELASLSANRNGGFTQWHLELLVTLPDVLESIVHGLFQTLHEEIRFPHVALDVLRPLEVGSNHTTGVS
jgi:hypothetical protein